jgi:hypothetical protein
MRGVNTKSHAGASLDIPNRENMRTTVLMIAVAAIAVLAANMVAQHGLHKMGEVALHKQQPKP